MAPRRLRMRLSLGAEFIGMPRGGIAPMLPTPAVVVVSPRSLRTLMLIGIPYLRYAIHHHLVPQSFQFMGGYALVGHSKGIGIDGVG